ncbi:hypothetical protein PoB_000035700 [Plakobranchus ocellatus]|uniref:Secreted protein n=1 Tax=Plakobranchus ocellatus TaxID=259542 RepID=A0AAV3XVH0_9GAST|nr:hypothetical protein PoB_000035700 [Plakobranchus ocellatus]
MLRDMWKFLVLILCLLVVADVSGDCDELFSCTNLVPGVDEFLEKAVTIAYNDAQDLDNFCPESRTVINCINAQFESCELRYIKDLAAAERNFLEHLCSDKGREQVLNLSEGECVHSDLTDEISMCMGMYTLEMRLEYTLARTEGREFDRSVMCPHLDELKDCLVDSGKDVCGEDMGAFITDIWSIRAPYKYEEFGCDANAERKRRFVTSSLQMLLKRSTLTKKLKK